MHPSDSKSSSSDTHHNTSPSSNSLMSFPLQELSWVERLAVRIMSRCNRPGLIHNVLTFWGTNVPQRFFTYLSKHRWEVHQSHHLDQIDRNASILLISNHKSFFDLFIATSMLRGLTNQELGKPCVFPVRSPFFYDNLLGILINFIGSGCCMYPPVFRDERKHTLNPHGLEIMQNLLQRPKLSLGLHPEGHRSKNQDPYVIEPARKGVGILIKNAKPNMVVLPIFITGLSNNPVKEFKQFWNKSSAMPIQIIWGAPKLASEYAPEVDQIAEEVHQQLQALANQAKSLADS